MRSLTYLIIGGLLFNLFFWNEKIGLNLILFDVFIVALLFRLYPYSFRSVYVKWLLLINGVSLVGIILSNSSLSLVSAIGSFTLLSMYIQYNHRSVVYALGSMATNLLLVPAMISEEWQSVPRSSAISISVRKIHWRLMLLPALLLMVFIVIYASANSVFSASLVSVQQTLDRIAKLVFSGFSWNRILFILLGIYLTALLILKARITFFSRKDLESVDVLTRRKNFIGRQSPAFLSKLFMGKLAFQNMALKHEYKIGSISLLLLNLLLLYINLIDINHIWLGESVGDGEPIYKKVHEGTELLILSILLAMAVLLSFFKGNLNFYSQNKWLKAGAYVWIFQNAVLVGSVLLRDLHYIEKYGLAYKRIGVLFFLLLVLVGLFTIYVKISLRKSNYFLVKANAWFAVTLLSVASLINWDSLIARYNIEVHQGTRDIPFLLSLSDNTLPILDMNKDKLMSDSVRQHAEIFFPEGIESYLEKRKLEFIISQKENSWLSWNLADFKIKKYLNSQTNNSND